MALRVSWTNNSSGHLGSYVYRAPTLDPQALPEPAAQVEPVAQGATAEWIDNEELAAGDYDYAVQDFDGGGVGTLSSVEVHAVPASLADAQIGDEIEGGIYAGIITYSDSRQFHLISAMAAAHVKGLQWGYYGTATGADDVDDGVANTDVIVGLGASASEAVTQCVNHSGGGHADWYLGSPNEVQVVHNALHGLAHPEYPQGGGTDSVWSSREVGAQQAYYVWQHDGEIYDSQTSGKNNSNTWTRPIRRVAA